MRVAVQQHDRRADRLGRDQEIGQQRRVGPVQPDIGVTEADMELQRLADVDGGPDQMPEQDRIDNPRRRVGIKRAEQAACRRRDLRRGGPRRIEVESEPVSDDRFITDRPRCCRLSGEFFGEGPGPGGGGRPRPGCLLGHYLEPDNVASRRAARPHQLLGGGHLVALVAGIDQPLAHPGRRQQAPVHLRRAKFSAAPQVVLRRDRGL